MRHTPFRHAFRSLVQRQPTLFKAVSLRFVPVAFVVIAGIYAGKAQAQLTLTPAAMAAHWDLTTFASSFKSTGSGYNGVGPLGIAFTDQGTVVVADYADGSVRVFPTDTDDQLASDAPVGQSYGLANAVGLDRVGNNFYMSQTSGAVVQIKPDGTFNQTIATGLTGAQGLAVNPKNGHLFVTSYDQTWIADVNPLQKTVSTFVTLPVSYGGLTAMTCDGVSLYVVAGNVAFNAGGHILGFHLSNKKQFFDSGYLLGAEGLALGQGAMSGYMFVNTNYGQVFQIDLSTQVITLIATGGSRGSGLTIDPDGSLLAPQADRIMRLTPPYGDNFETASVAVKPSIVAGSTNAIGTVTLGTPAPIDLVVVLASSDPTLAQPVDASGNPISSVTVPAGSLTATFPITTTAVSTTTTGQILATLNGVTSTATLKVRPIGVHSVVLTPKTIKGGNTVTGTVTLEGAAPGNITVTFTSSDPAVVPTPASLVIPAGQKSVTFTVTTTTVTTKTTVTLSATANSITSSANLVVTP